MIKWLTRRNRHYPLAAVILLSPSATFAQTEDRALATQSTIQAQVQSLAKAVSQEAAALAASQQQIEELRQQVSDLQTQLATMQPTVAGLPPHQEDVLTRLEAQVEVIHEQQDIQKSELATHDQEKVESASRFPVRLTGMILMNAFVNTGGVDVIQSPTSAVEGYRTSGLTLRQSVLGLDARSAHLFGGTTAADVRIDFFGNINQTSYTNTAGVVRLRTAHGEFNRNQTRAFFEVDRPIISPITPTSLTAIAQPALAWSGNLWNWIPQAGVDQIIQLSETSRIKMSAAIADIPDPRGSPTIGASTGAITTAPPTGQTYSALSSTGERSRWPASELRVGYSSGQPLTGLQFGLGGYFSPHTIAGQLKFTAWAATADFRVPLPAHLEASGSIYRGAGLGGLGAGAFKDYVNRSYNGANDIRALDDVGGWIQLKARATQRVEFNAAYGIDNAFVGELRGYTSSGSAEYQNLARNATFFTNVIYSPTAYTLFTFEYRRLDTSSVTGLHAVSGVLGAAAAYRF